MTGVTDMTSEIKEEEGIRKCKIGCKVADRSTVPEWYAGTSHRLQTGVQYPVGTQEGYTSSEQVVRTKVKV